MKSDNWLIERVINEFLSIRDISHVRKLLQEGMSDEEVLLSLRKRMFSNSKGMRAYIRQEKIRALMLKLSYRIHWVYLLPIIKRWLREKEALIRWRESKHYNKIDEKARELKGKLIDEYDKVKIDCINTGEIPEDVMSLIERTAEELLLQIEKEELDRLPQSKEDTGLLDRLKNKTIQPDPIRKEKPHLVSGNAYLI